MPADSTHPLVAAARRRAEGTRQRAVAALRRLDNTGAAVSFDAVARAAGVSRSWLYTQPDPRAEITRLRGRHRPPPTTPAPPDQHRASHASLLRRLEAAAARIHRLEQDNRELRNALARALGEHRAAAITGPHAHDTPETHPGKLIGPC